MSDEPVRFELGPMHVFLREGHLWQEAGGWMWQAHGSRLAYAVTDAEAWRIRRGNRPPGPTLTIVDVDREAGTITLSAKSEEE